MFHSRMLWQPLIHVLWMFIRKFIAVKKWIRFDYCLFGQKILRFYALFHDFCIFHSQIFPLCLILQNFPISRRHLVCNYAVHKAAVSFSLKGGRVQQKHKRPLCRYKIWSRNDPLNSEQRHSACKTSHSHLNVIKFQHLLQHNSFYFKN